jgi:hypothetical protein
MKSFAWQRFVDEPYLITEIEIVPIVRKDKVVIIHVRTREPRAERGLSRMLSLTSLKH